MNLSENIGEAGWQERLLYPRLFILAATIAFALFIYHGREALLLSELLHEYPYVASFIAGFFLAYGFTAAPATALLLIIGGDSHIVARGLVAGVGGLAGDLLIFKYVRYSFQEEIRRLREWRLWEWWAWERLRAWLPHPESRLHQYLVLTFAGLLIASPLPDEIGVSILAASPHLSTRNFAVISYVLNTLGIFALLFIGEFMGN
jgi:uncharacterized membrane protein YdjX (TVP38/TMEM64 family)